MAVDYDLVIIGGGAAGLVAASAGAQLKAKVALVEQEDRLGGDCLHYGWVPSKSLIHASRVAHEVARGPEFGVIIATHVAGYEGAVAMQNALLLPTKIAAYRVNLYRPRGGAGGANRRQK